jgi:hypothetical protein
MAKGTKLGHYPLEQIAAANNLSILILPQTRALATGKNNTTYIQDIFFKSPLTSPLYLLYHDSQQL